MMHIFNVNQRRCSGCNKSQENMYLNETVAVRQMQTEAQSKLCSEKKKVRVIKYNPFMQMKDPG